MHPAALGLLILVPFMSWFIARFQTGMLVIAPPGAQIETAMGAGGGDNGGHNDDDEDAAGPGKNDG